jgi:hypothetical protein
MNAKSWFVGTGDEIATITIASTIPNALCTEDGSGFLANHVYIRHFDDVAQEWSGWDDIFIDNAESRLSLFRPTLQEEMFQWDVNGGAVATAVADNSQFLRLRTNAATNNWAQADTGGLQASLSSRMEWHTKFQIDGATGTNPAVLWRMGVGMERVQENSETTLQKFGIEGCGGDGITIQLVSCNGASRFKTPTGVAMDQAAAIGVKVAYIPSTSVIYEDTIGTTKPSTGGIPSSGSVHSDKMLRYGIKTTNTSEKLMYIWADALFGKVLDPSWI